MSFCSISRSLVKVVIFLYWGHLKHVFFFYFVWIPFQLCKCTTRLFINAAAYPHCTLIPFSITLHVIGRTICTLVSLHATSPHSVRTHYLKKKKNPSQSPRQHHHNRHTIYDLWPWPEPVKMRVATSRWDKTNTFRLKQQQ